MSAVFLDTSALIASVNRDDQWYAVVNPHWRSLTQSNRPLITTTLVLLETGDGLARVNLRPLAINLHRRLTTMDGLRILRPSPDQERRGWELFEQRPDKDWGVTDCVSMVVMQDEGVIEVFTFDRHFAQAGFQLITSVNTN